MSTQNGCISAHKLEQTSLIRIFSAQQVWQRTRSIPVRMLERLKLLSDMMMQQVTKVDCRALSSETLSWKRVAKCWGSLHFSEVCRKLLSRFSQSGVVANVEREGVGRARVRPPPLSGAAQLCLVAWE